MKKMLLLCSTGCIMALSAGCAVFVSPDPDPVQTTVEAENNLTGMSVDVNGATTDVDGIDLESVGIGDVSYASIAYGTTSSQKATSRSGDVTVSIGTAVVYTVVLGQSVPVSISNISPMSAVITSGTVNTVVFNQSTAGVIFEALAKRSTP